MKIGIDARFVGPEGTGLGMYTEKLINNLQKIDKKNTYAIFLKGNNWNYLSIKQKNFHKVIANVNWYSLQEQLKMPSLYKNENLDLLHVPHFNVPLMYKKKFIVTIHDLIHHNFTQEAVTTRNPVLFKIKRFGYRKTIEHALKKSSKIITPSMYVKKEIEERFIIDPNKITITYEAAEEEYLSANDSTKTSPSFNLIYVGNAYPHKNLDNLLKAIKLLNNVNLVIVCPRDIFYNRLSKKIIKQDLKSKVTLIGYLSREKLVELFRKSQVFISPSMSEGFGIPGLNAMAAGIPVTASDIPTYKEVYKKAALFFNPNDPNDIANKIYKIINSESVREKLISSGKKLVNNYSWQKMAVKTLKIYEKI